MAIVKGEKNIVKSAPSQLSEEEMRRAMEEVKEAQREGTRPRRSEPDCLRPSTPNGFAPPVWSTTRNRWTCQSKSDRKKFVIWDVDETSKTKKKPPTPVEKKWHDFLKWEQAHAMEAPHGFKLKDKPASKTFFGRIFSTAGTFFVRQQ